MPIARGAGDAAFSAVFFALGAWRCALRHDAVAEVLPLPHLHRLPAAPEVVEGFFSLGGVAVPVIGLTSLLGVAAPARAESSTPSRAQSSAPSREEAGAYRHLILLRPEAGLQVALLVARVLDVVPVSPATLRPVADTTSLNGCVEALVEADDGSLTHLLAADRILLAQEKLALRDLGIAAAERLRGWGIAAG
jgi:purine-binding chemotaxis protein CheW